MANYSIKKTLIQIFDVPLAIVQRFRSDRITRHAAALSFNSLLALAPMMAIAFAMLSMFASFEQVGSNFQNFIYQFLVPAAGDEFQSYVEQFAGQAGKLTLVGLGLFLLTALILLFSIEESFNDIWRLERGRSVTARISVYWALMTLGPILMAASLGVSTYLLGMKFTHGVEIAVQMQSFGLVMLPFLFEILAFLLLYLVMPNVRVAFVHGLVGAFVASLLFELTKRGFALYVINFNNYEVIYGALSSLPIFLIWIYLSWVVALVGAEVVAVLQQKKMFASLDGSKPDTDSAD